MKLRKWDELPSGMQNDAVRKYYDVLCTKKAGLKIKRLFDVWASASLLVLLFPVFLILAAVIKRDSRGPVFFRQERVTQYGRIFRIYKFRTMTDGAHRTGMQVTIKNDARITKAGKVLRKYRLDELPQLLNILAGDMTFVGTRPEVPYYVRKYRPEMRATLLLPAGVTSEASIHFKDEEKLLEHAQDADRIYLEKILPRKMKYNLRQLEGFSICRDMKTLLHTAAEIAGG